MFYDTLYLKFRPIVRDTSTSKQYTPDSDNTLLSRIFLLWLILYITYLYIIDRYSLIVGVLRLENIIKPTYIYINVLPKISVSNFYEVFFTTANTSEQYTLNIIAKILIKNYDPIVKYSNVKIIQKLFI